MKFRKEPKTENNGDNLIFLAKFAERKQKLPKILHFFFLQNMDSYFHKSLRRFT